MYEGIPTIIVEVPEGKRIKIIEGIAVDTSTTPHSVEFEDLPKSEMDRISEELEKTQLALAELAESLMSGGQ